MVRRGNTYFVPRSDQPSVTAARFSYGDAGDEVLVGDWNGDGVDTLAVRRGNHYLLKNDNTSTGKADADFSYGDPWDLVLVGNWDGRRVQGTAGQPAKGDTLMVRRGGQYFVKNDLRSGVAEYSFFFGNQSDEILVGDWEGTRTTSDNRLVKAGGDGADQLAARRGVRIYFSSEVAAAGRDRTNPAVERSWNGIDEKYRLFVGAAYRPDDDVNPLPAGEQQKDHLLHADYIGLRYP
jgi:hypothetical protein